MIEGVPVVDAVVHPYDLAPENRIEAARDQLDAVYAAHAMATGDEHDEFRLTPEEFFTDFPYEALAHALFVESPVDFAVIHSLPNLGFTRSYVTDPDRAAAFRDRHPNRFGLYATVDSPSTDEAIAQLERQVREHQADSLKLYPAFFYGGSGHGWRLDSGDFAIPLLEAAQDLGVRNISVHKALWLPPAPRESFDIDDLSIPLDRFPTLNFFMVHAGTAFLDETCMLLRRHRNFHATLETTFSYLVVRPRVFARVLARMLRACGPDQLLYASGANLSHPAPLLRAFEGYELPDQVVEEVGVAQLTAADRAKIVGGNALALHGLDPTSVLASTADDAFSRQRREGGHVPWALLREGALHEAPA